MTKYQQLKEACGKVGVRVARWSPGDGITRYRFFTAINKLYLLDRDISYFEADGDCTALGYKEACIYAKGRGANI